MDIRRSRRLHLVGLAALAWGGVQWARADGPTLAEIRVGIDAGDIRGSDNRALQAAVDRIANLGGGIVHIGPGRYTMRNALFLRDHVHVKGTPGATVLMACDGIESPLACDGDCNERQVTLKQPAGFQIGDGISVQDDRFASGFTVTTATLTARLNDNAFTITTPLYLDYMVAEHATARIAFPIVGGWNVRDATVEGLTIEGNRAKRAKLDGCRGGGIFLFECQDIAIKNCVVRHYNGDGISFQVSQRVEVTGCTAEGNTGLGLHPGSGSQHPLVRHNRSIGNGGDGLYVCWRVKYGQFEGNELRDNKGAGISIGHKDSDNVFRQNVIEGNAGTGVLFREETEPMGAHRNVFEANRIVDNGRGGAAENTAAITIRGCHNGLRFRSNEIGISRPSGLASIGILQDPRSSGLHSEGNRFLNVRTEAAVKQFSGQSAAGELVGWKSWHEKPDVRTGDVWQLDSEGVLHCKGTPRGCLYSEKDYSDFVLTFDWRWVPGKKAGSGGVLLRMTGAFKIWPRSLEAQINAGDAGDFWGLDGYRLSGPSDRMKKLTHPQFGSLINLKKLQRLEKPPGEWNHYEIRAQGEIVTLRINGQEANRATGCAPSSGRICLTSEGDPYQFRNVRLTILGGK